VISEDGIVVNPKKIKPIMEWHTLEYVADIRSLMGITSYYQRFIEVFSRISYLITSLPKKGIKFNWSQK
jgi:hypothetical protein